MQRKRRKGRASTETSVENEIAHLRGLDLRGLRARWQVRFATRIRKAVTAAGWKTVGEIREASDTTLLSLQDLGQGSVAHLRETLGLTSKEGVRPDGRKAKK